MNFIFFNVLDFVKGKRGRITNRESHNTSSAQAPKFWYIESWMQRWKSSFLSSLASYSEVYWIKTELILKWSHCLHSLLLGFKSHPVSQPKHIPYKGHMTSLEQLITIPRLVQVKWSKMWNVNTAKYRSCWLLLIYKLNLASAYLSCSVLSSLT